MKRSVLICTLSIATVLACNKDARSQMLQTLIASPGSRNELITCVKALPDGSSILGGYIYDIVSNSPTNIDMLLLRVKPDGKIIWQKQIGSSGDDLLNGMIITQNTDVVVVGTVGRSSMFVNNTAAIYRFDTSGTLLWQKYVRTTPGATQAGDRLSDVAELANGTLIAVGTHDFAPNVSSSMICSITGSGTLNYIETHNHTGSDDFWGVCAVGNDVIITGAYDGSTYKDCRVLRYTPGTTSGTIVWDKSFDFTASTSPSGIAMKCDVLTSVFVRGGKVVASGGQARDWNSKPPNIPVVFQCDLATGNNARLRGMLSKNLDFGNNYALYPVDSALYYTAQNPDSLYEDAVVWTAPSFTNALISKVQPFNATGQVLASREFDLPGEQSIFSMDMLPNVLFMAGCSNAGGTTAINNDIYYVVSMSSLTNPNASCDLIDDSMRVTSPTLVPKTFSETVASPTSTATFTVTFSNPNLVSSKACGEVFDVLGRPSAVPGIEPGPDQFKLYPNPVVNELMLIVPGDRKLSAVDVVVMNATGQRVLTSTARLDAEGKGRVYTSTLSAGNYFLRLSEGGKTIGIRHFVIAK